MTNVTATGQYDAIRYANIVAYCTLSVLGFCNFPLLYAACAKRLLPDTFANTLMINLTIANCALVVSIPVTLAFLVNRSWAFGPTVCKLYYAFENSNKLSAILFLGMMCCDRFVMVKFPVQAIGIRTKRNAITLSLVAWLFVIAALAPVFVFANTIELGLNRTLCIILWPWERPESVYFYLQFAAFFLIPTALIIMLYSFMLLQFRSMGHVTARRPSRGNGPPRFRYYRTTISILLTIAFYLLCYAPFWLTQLAVRFINVYTMNPHIATWIRTSHFLPYVYIALTPLIQAVCSRNLAKTLRIHACCFCDPKRVSDGMTTRQGPNAVSMTKGDDNGGMETWL